MGRAGSRAKRPARLGIRHARGGAIKASLFSARIRVPQSGEGGREVSCRECGKTGREVGLAWIIRWEWRELAVGGSDMPHWCCLPARRPVAPGEGGCAPDGCNRGAALTFKIIGCMNLLQVEADGLQPHQRCGALPLCCSPLFVLCTHADPVTPQLPAPSAPDLPMEEVTIVVIEDRRDALSWLLNVIWIFNGGLQTASLWLVAGFLCCLTIVGIPVRCPQHEPVAHCPGTCG